MYMVAFGGKLAPSARVVLQ
ncbi:rCG49417 [Rattus norvegicus]|uniref:RCG49417 n=1 Tax=Rattus norvegicus TaxID=10116 RepID=A6J2H2_RAT|nr:rCG49417 [Rattus norvegicus]